MPVIKGDLLHGDNPERNDNPAMATSSAPGRNAA